MRFSILGPLAAEADDGAPVTIGRPSQRTTLAVLLMHTGQPPTKAALINALWGDSPPGDAETALRARIRDLRKAFGPHDRLETTALGYRVRVLPGELDAEVFSSLVAHGRAVLDAGGAEDAARLLDQAARLWREPSLADLPDTPAMRTATTALLEHFRDAREWLVDARLALGQHHEVLGDVRAAIAADPLREHPHVQLMLALYRCGHKAAALAAYGRLRDVTARELGQDPGPEARELLGLILDDSPYLQFRPRALAASLDGRPVWTPLCQLPAPPADFTGRVAVIQELASLMPGAGAPGPGGLAACVPITVLSGPPGVGKTALAVRAAHLAKPAYPDGQLYVGLGGTGQAREPGDVLGDMLRSLGVLPARVPDSVAERAALYRSLLAGRRVLVLADDAASAAQVRPLLPGTAGSSMLVTSSRRLADLEGARHVAIAALTRAEAIALLGKIAGADRVAAEPDAAATIADACCGLPLAVRIAGARLAASPMLRLAELAASLRKPGCLLDELVVGDLSVSTRLAGAWSCLDADSRRALREFASTGRCGVPAGSAMPAVLRSLADACLVIDDPAAGGYRLAPLVGCYAAARPEA